VSEKTVITRTGGVYEAREREVYCTPIETRWSDGTITHSFGFLVCSCNEYVDGAAEEIAAALNEKEGKK